MKKNICKAITFILLLLLVGCGKKSSSSDDIRTEIRIASLKGPTSIGLVKLYNDSDNQKTANSYQYSIYGAADEISTKLIKNELDVAAIPANLASILYNKSNGEIKVLGINTLGVLYILAKGSEIQTVNDLKGKTIYTTGQGTTPEYTLRHLLTINNLNPDKDVKIEFLSEASEVVAKCSEMKSAIMLLPEPYVEVALAKDDSFSIAIDISKEWSDGVTGVIVARKDFVEKNPKLIDAFLNEYKASTEFANNNTNECADLLEQFDIFKATIAKKAIAKCNVTLITGNEFVDTIDKYYQVLFTENPASVGGKIPDSNAYYIN